MAKKNPKDTFPPALKSETLQEAGLEVDSRLAMDPIAQSWRMGDFFRGLLRTKRFPWLRILFALGFFILPYITIFNIVNFDLRSSQAFSTIFWLCYTGLMVFIGILIMRKATQDLIHPK